VDDVHTETDCWCTEATAVLNAVKTRHSALIAGTKAVKFGTGGYHWQNLALLAGSVLVLPICAARWFGRGTKAEDGVPAGPGLREQIVTGLQSGREFFSLHLVSFTQQSAPLLVIPRPFADRLLVMTGDTTGAHWD